MRSQRRRYKAIMNYKFSRKRNNKTGFFKAAAENIRDGLIRLHIVDFEHASEIDTSVMNPGDCVARNDDHLTPPQALLFLNDNDALQNVEWFRQDALGWITKPAPYHSLWSAYTSTYLNLEDLKSR